MLRSAFGTEQLDGAQAEFVGVPLAGTTVVKAPGTVTDKALIFIADIFPTGQFGVSEALSRCA